MSIVHQLTLNVVKRNIKGDNIVEIVWQNKGFEADIKEKVLAYQKNQFIDCCDTLILHILKRNYLENILSKIDDFNSKRIIILQHNKISPDFLFKEDGDRISLTIKEIRSICRKNNLSIKQVDYAVITPPFFRKNKKIAYLFEDLLQRYFLRYFARNIIVIIDPEK